METVEGKGKQYIANSFEGERARSLYDRHGGFVHGSAERFYRSVKWAQRGCGLTPYPGSASKTDRRGVLAVTERGFASVDEDEGWYSDR